MDVRMLGPVEIWINGRAITLRARPQQWTVLAALAVDAGQVLGVDSLVGRVWRAQPPDCARRTLHSHISHISRIRRLLDERSAADRPL